MKRRIYLVRHGRTIANEAEVIQTPEDPLTEHGLEQARILAERIIKIPFDTLVSSDLLRARDTAQRIAQATGHTSSESPLLREMSYSTGLFGKSHGDEAVAEYYRQKLEHIDDPDWRWGDEESFAAAHARVVKAFAYLESLPGTVVAVTHGHFIRFLITRLLLGEAMRPREAHHAMYKLLTNNTAITALEEREGQWYLLTWNDHAHLG